ncbi:hypothetical protein ACWDAZ_05655, partial [Streptomyces sp. NPDC001215]
LGSGGSGPALGAGGSGVALRSAAGIALCRAAGCTVTGIDGAPLGPEGRGLVAAADAETHGQLMSMIHSQEQQL